MADVDVDGFVQPPSQQPDGLLRWLGRLPRMYRGSQNHTVDVETVLQRQVQLVSEYSRPWSQARVLT